MSRYKKNSRYLILHLYIYIFVILETVLCLERITYISTERPRVTFYDPKCLQAVNLTTVRYGRRNPVYFVTLEYIQLIYITNNVKVDFYFHEFLSNQYQRTFVEMHFGWCDLIHKDPFFGAAMKQGRLAEPCPYPPGEYHMYNMSIPPAAIPRCFPFRKGRIYANLTLNKQPLAAGHIDMELKQLKSETKVTKL